MIFRDFVPLDPLMIYIDRYRLLHFVFERNVISTFKPFPPRPEQYMFFFPRGKETTEYVKSSDIIQRSRSVISGQFTCRVNRYASSPEFLMIQVLFKPGALHRLTGIPFTLLTNTGVDAEAVFSSGLSYVNARLNSTDSYTEMIAIIESFFLTLASKVKIELQPVDKALNLVVKDGSVYRLDWLTKMAFLSPRQLERKFNERVGVCPKTFLRISRFNQSYWMRLKNPGMDLFSIAIACGYNDYQHMVKDYKEFANTTPNLLFNDESNAPERLLGLNK